MIKRKEFEKYPWEFWGEWDEKTDLAVAAG